MKILQPLLDLLYVPHCPACDERMPSGLALCPRCAESLYELGPACPRCAAPADLPPARLCRRCRRAPPPLAAILAPYRYGGELAVALQRLKFQRRPDIARALAPLLRPALSGALERIDVAVPVPLHRRRLARRGFNQSALLLAHASRGKKLAIDRASLVRRRADPPQSGLGARERARNVAGAFAVTRRRRPQIAGRRVLLFDDVATTCATLSAAARALRAAGATEILGLCFARAEPP